MSEKPGNQTPNTPGVSETALREKKVDELREEAKRRLNFIYQEERSDGNRSTFFRLESPDREDG